MLTDPSYRPVQFLNWLVLHLELKNDSALSKKIGIPRPLISKIRNRKMPIGPSFILRVHEVADIPVKEMRKRMYAV